MTLSWQLLDDQQVRELLAEGELETEGLVPWSSNYTLLIYIRKGGVKVPAIYKPTRGERPLWDFPAGTLCRREVACYVLSKDLGWPNIPPTVLREGPLGVGSVQLFIPTNFEEHYFTLRERGGFDDSFRHIALFDALVNNADRKGGHLLLDEQGRVWAIDHGLTFHHLPKLRSVIWDYAGQRLPANLAADLGALQTRLAAGAEVAERLQALIAPEEYRVFVARLERLLTQCIFPLPGPGRNVPYPPV